MEEKPIEMKCNECGRTVTSDKDIKFVDTPGLGKGTGFWYSQCKWCRGANTRRSNNRK